MYVLVDKDGAIEDLQNDFRQLLPSVSFKADITNDELVEYGIYPTIDFIDYDKNKQVLVTVAPYKSGELYYTVVVDDLQVSVQKDKYYSALKSNFYTKLATKPWNDMYDGNVLLDDTAVQGNLNTDFKYKANLLRLAKQAKDAIAAAITEDDLAKVDISLGK